MFIRKLAPLALALGMAFAGTAHADVVTKFNLLDGSGNTIVKNADGLDWNERGSGVAIGAGPFADFIVLPPGATFDFRYQANLVNVSGGTRTLLARDLDSSSDGVVDLGATYEFTIAAKLKEVVTSSGVIGGKPTAFFGIGGTNADNKVAIFYDTAANANTLTGTGFDDGIMIALLTVTASGTTSQFSTIPGSGTGQGSAKMSAEIVEAGDFINTAYLQGIEKLLFGMDFESNLNYPANTSATDAFHIGGTAQFADYAVGTNDIVFKVDGSNQFTQVPEPGSLVLLGIGMLGFVGAARRRSAKKA